MGLCASIDIFKAKVDDLLGGIEGIRAYMDNIIVLDKEILSQHMNQLRFMFYRLHAAVIKAIDPKCIFGLKDIPYLGYIITQEEIKPD